MVVLRDIIRVNKLCLICIKWKIIIPSLVKLQSESVPATLPSNKESISMQKKYILAMYGVIRRKSC